MTTSRLPVVDQIFGHNKAPISEVLAADFAELTKDVTAAIAGLDALPKSLKDDADLGLVGKAVVDLRALYKRIESVRTDEGEPLLLAKRELDAFFKDMTARIEASAKIIQTRADDYTRRKEAEAREEARRAAEENRRREEAERARAERAASDQTAARAEGRAEQFAASAERAEEAANAKPEDLVRTKVGGVTASGKTELVFEIVDYDAIPLDKLRPYLDRAAIEKAIKSFQRVHKQHASLPGVKFDERTVATFRK